MIIRSVHDNQATLLEGIISLIGPIECDLTWGKGAMWKQTHAGPHLKIIFRDRENIENPQDFAVPRDLPVQRFLYFKGLRPENNIIRADVTSLPFKNNFLGTSIFDPPFIAGSHVGNSIFIKSGYGAHESTRAMLEFYKKALDEIYRALRPDAYLIFKCQDFVKGSVNTFPHIDIFNIAIHAGFAAHDLFLLTAKTRPISPMKKQRHARKFHCFFWVFRKKRPRGRPLKEGKAA